MSGLLRIHLPLSAPSSSCLIGLYTWAAVSVAWAAVLVALAAAMALGSMRMMEAGCVELLTKVTVAVSAL